MECEAGLKLPHSAQDSHLRHYGEDHLPHDHVEELGRIDCRRGNSFLVTFWPTAQSKHTLEAIFWDASRHRFGQPGFDLLMTSTKRVPAQRLFKRHVTVIRRLIDLLRYQRNCSRTHRILQATVPASCSPPSLPFMSSYLSSVSSFFHSHRAHPLGPAAFFALHVFIFFIIWSTSSSHIFICGGVSHKWDFPAKFCHVGFASLSLMKMSFHALAIAS